MSGLGCVNLGRMKLIEVRRDLVQLVGIEAEGLARSIDNKHGALRESALGEIAQVAVAVGDFARAVAIADELDASAELRLIARQLAEAGQIDDSRRTLARSWRRDTLKPGEVLAAKWLEPLPDLELVDIQALRDIARTPPETFVA